MKRRTSQKKPLVPLRTESFIAFAAVTAIASSCSLDSGAPRIRVAMPTQGAQQISFGLGASAASMSAPAAPDSFSQFTCFGLNVTGQGVGKTPICANDPSTGVIGGFAAFSGGVVDVRVPAGQNRRVELLGAMTGDGSCPIVAAMNPTEGGPEISVFHLGSTETDLFEDKRVSIQAHYIDAASAIPRLEGCGEHGGNGSGPYFPDAGSLMAPVQGWWDVGWSASPMQGNWADGTSVAPSWMPRAGIFSAPAGTSRTYHQNGPNNGRPSLVFAANSYAGSGGGGAMNSPPGLTWMVVASRSIGATQQTLASLTYNASQEFKVGFNNADQFLVHTNGAVTTGPVSTTGIPYIVTGTFDGGTQSLYVNGVFAGSAASSLSGSNTAIKFGAGYAGEYFTGEISELILYSQNLPPNDREALECHLGQKYNIPVTGHTFVQCN